MAKSDEAVDIIFSTVHLGALTPSSLQGNINSMRIINEFMDGGVIIINYNLEIQILKEADERSLNLNLAYYSSKCFTNMTYFQVARHLHLVSSVYKLHFYRDFTHLADKFGFPKNERLHVLKACKGIFHLYSLHPIYPMVEITVLGQSRGLILVSHKLHFIS